MIMRIELLLLIPNLFGLFETTLTSSLRQKPLSDDCRCVVEQETLSLEITPLTKAQSDVDFYDYNTIPASSNTGLEVPDQSRIYLFENSLSGDLSLITNHDMPNDGDGGTAYFTYYGIPTGSFWSVRDDPGDSYLMSPPDASANWRWFVCCTDGGSIRLGAVCDFEITIIPTFGFNDGGTITSWVVLSGDITSPDVIPLPSLTDTVTIRCSTCQPLCDQRTQGFWRRVCEKPHPEEPNGVDPYVNSVVDLGAPIFDGFTSEDVCALMEVSPPENDPCRKAKRQFMALLLNISSGRLTICQDLIDGRTVEDAVVEIKTLLLSGSDENCKTAQEIAASINEGTLLRDCESKGSLIHPEDPHLFLKSSQTISPKPLIRYTVPDETGKLTKMYPSTIGTERIMVSLKIYDILGREVISLLEETKNPGTYSIEWNGKDSRENSVPSGIYFSRLRVGELRATQKLILIH